VWQPLSVPGRDVEDVDVDAGAPKLRPETSDKFSPKTAVHYGGSLLIVAPCCLAGGSGRLPCTLGCAAGGPGGRFGHFELATVN